MGKEFKAAMDSYEAFIDEYVAFMKKYEKSDGTDPQMIADYGKYIIFALPSSVLSSGNISINIPRWLQVLPNGKTRI